jgi:hypothetical protein
MLLSSSISFGASTAPAGTRAQTELSGTGWTAWLDKSASWQNDSLRPTGVNLATLTVNAPTGGWAQLFSNPIAWQSVGTNASAVLQVNVPGTVEEYFWNANNGQEYKGVSWWGRDFTMTSWTGKKVMLLVENARLRCEVYVNQKLVGYDGVGNLPFESDITGALVSGTNKLAIRITNPGGNFSWEDRGAPIVWGNQKVMLNHSFSGIMGKVFLIVEDPVAIKDVFVKNKPTITDVDVAATVTNQGTSSWSGSMTMDVMTNDSVPASVYSTTITGLSLNAGASTVVTKTISVPSAKLWDLGQGNLYFVKAVLKDGSGTDQDGFMQRFGFRWLEVANHVGSSNQTANTMFRLNGRRIFIMSAISWGFFPANGMYATPAIAAAQIDAAQKIGLNMLNFHRCIGQTIILDAADEKGLLYYEEVGGYESYYNVGCSPPAGYTGAGCAAYTGRLQAREKILRMVTRDRNHPSLIHYNMQNEADNDPIAEAKQDMRDAHALDPSRTITYSSGFMGNGSPGNNKLHMIANDTTQYNYGFSDEHNTYNPGSYADTCYMSPTNYMRYTTCSNELTFLGEESSISTLPRLQKLHDYYSNTANPRGWDGNDYLDWYNGFTTYISSKALQTYYPSLDSFTLSCGNIAYYFHGRLIENVRMNNYRDGYAINGWECMKSDNHSGIVDQLRDLKGDPKLLTDYTRPLYVAVKSRQTIEHVGDQAHVDAFIVNENALAAGTYTLTITVLKPSGATAQVFSGSVKITGGDTFGELLTQNITIALDGGAGYYHLKAKLLNGAAQVADGHEQILTVDWKSMVVPTTGAIASSITALTTFLNTTKGLNLPQYSNSLGTLKYIVATGAGNFTPSDLLNRVKNDGTTLIIVDNANTWMTTLTSSGVVTGSVGTMTQSQNWVGGGYFVRKHPMFNSLPVNCAMNWEYQNFINYNLPSGNQYGFQMTGEEPVVTDWDNHEHRLCTSVGILTYGKGKIIFSTIDMVDYLPLSTGASNVSKKVLLNYMTWGADPTVTTFIPVVDPVDTSATNVNSSGTAHVPAMIEGVSVTRISKGVRIQYSAPIGNETVALRIYDVAGKTLWTFSGAASAKGVNNVFWKPDRMVAGTYFLQVKAFDGDRSHHFVTYHKFILFSAK